MTEHRTPEAVITEALSVYQTSYTSTADRIMRALGEAGFDVIDALYVYGSEQTWTDADLLTLIMTAGEIASHYGTGTDGLAGLVLSTLQRQVLARARRQYHAELGDEGTDTP